MGDVQQKEDNLLKGSEERAVYYHEKQRWQFCAIHAVNNMLQADFDSEHFATRAEFDDIAKRLTKEEYELGASSWFSLSNHYTPLIGNYSFEVLEIALRARKVGIEWYNQDFILNENDPSTIGFICNSLKDGWSKYLPVARRHWFAIHRSSPKARWLLIDSYQKDIQTFVSINELIIFIQSITNNDGSVMRCFHV